MLNEQLAIRVIENLGRMKDINILKSDAIGTNSAATTEGVTIPDGGYVKQVAIANLGTVAITSADIDVGDGNSADRFIDGLTDLAVGDIVVAPVPAADVASDEVAGHYYSSSDTIDIKVNATCPGELTLLAWYTKID